MQIKVIQKTPNNITFYNREHIAHKNHNQILSYYDAELHPDQMDLIHGFYQQSDKKTKSSYGSIFVF